MTKKTLQQQLADSEARTARIKAKLKKERDGAIYVVGGRLVERARKDAAIRDMLIRELNGLTREQDIKRVAPLLAELSDGTAQVQSDTEGLV